MTLRKKQIQLFMTSADERTYSDALKGQEDSLLFVDGNVWNSELPVFYEDIQSCNQGIVYLWNRRIFPNFPTIARNDGRYEGPISGVVIQFVRSRTVGDLLLSGRIAVGYDDENEQYDEFVKTAFKTLKNCAKGGLASVAPISEEVLRERVTEYVVGLDAASRLRQGLIRLLKDRSTETYFQLKDQLRK